MQILSTFDELPFHLQGRRSCLTIGVFDGVHLGHQALIRETVKLAQEQDIVSIAVSFRNHPLSVLAPPYNPLRLITPARKADLLEQMGIQFLILANFTKEFAAMPPQRFMSECLVEKANVQHLVCGYDFTFGCQGSGKIEMLENFGTETGFNVQSISAVSHENHAVKSTHIRDLLSNGRVSEAATLLTRPHELPGTVGSGMQRGRTIGFPTANLNALPHFQVPGKGVYLCGARVAMREEILAAMVNVGTSPTFGNNAASVEAHLLNFTEDIYEQSLSVFFLKHLREEQKFAGVDALVGQLQRDKEQSENLWESVLICELIAKIPAPVAHNI